MASAIPGNPFGSAPVKETENEQDSSCSPASLITGLTVALLMVNYFGGISGYVSSEILFASLNISLATTIILASLYCYAKGKKEWDKASTLKMLFFTAVAAVALGALIANGCGYDGYPSANTMAWINFAPLLGMCGYKLYSAYKNCKTQLGQ